jgi:hypothetical protein
MVHRHAGRRIAAQVEEGPSEGRHREPVDNGDVLRREPACVDDDADRRSRVSSPRDEHLDVVAVSVGVAAMQTGAGAPSEDGVGSGEVERGAASAGEVERVVTEPVDATAE